jgi:hypothetical protein
MIAVVVLLALVLLRVVLLCVVAYLLVPAGRFCPACGQETIPLARAGMVRLVPGVERRWCMACGWSWYRKRGAPVVLPPHDESRVRSRSPGEPAGWTD